jgi:hypothetical protein
MNRGQETPPQYIKSRSSDAAAASETAHRGPDRHALAFRDAIPVEDVDFLEALPFCGVLGRYAFVHAGFLPGPLKPQMAELRAHKVTDMALHPAMRAKDRPRSHDPSWSHTVVRVALFCSRF